MTIHASPSPPRCVIYTRVSTEEQGREGASLPVQLQACRQYAARAGWTIAAEPRDKGRRLPLLADYVAPE